MVLRGPWGRVRCAPVTATHQHQGLTLLVNVSAILDTQGTVQTLCGTTTPAVFPAVQTHIVPGGNQIIPLSVPIPPTRFLDHCPWTSVSVLPTRPGCLTAIAHVTMGHMQLNITPRSYVEVANSAATQSHRGPR